MERLIILFLFHVFIFNGYSQNSGKAFFDVVYAQVNKSSLKLDLYLPKEVERPNLIIWIHGGSWISGDKKNPPLALVKKGYALASINYRLTSKAKFPAQVHDIKAAIRFLRAKAQVYVFNAENIVVMGSSAGGHLAALVGVTNYNEALEGTIGDYLNASSSVQGIVDFYGPTNFMTIIGQSTAQSRKNRLTVLKKLFGGLPENKTDIAKLASPVYNIDKTDPPLLIMHGNNDLKVPINQSLELVDAYKKQNLEVYFKVVYEGAHGGPEFETPENYNEVFKFLDKIFKAKS